MGCQLNRLEQLTHNHQALGSSPEQPTTKEKELLMLSNFVLHVDIEFLEEIAMKAQVYTEEDNDMAQVLFGDLYNDNRFYIFSLNPDNYSPLKTLRSILKNSGYMISVWQQLIILIICLWFMEKTISLQNSMIKEQI